MRMSLDSYLIIGCLVVFVHGNAVKINGYAEKMLLPFRPPLSEEGGDKGYDLPIGQECHIDIGLQILQPIVREGIADSSPKLNFACKEGEGWHL